MTPSSDGPSTSGIAERHYDSKIALVSQFRYKKLSRQLLGASYGAGLFIYKLRLRHALPTQRPLTRITFDDGLQIGATWSPDGRFIAYNSDRGGKFDIWVQQISGGDPVQVTKGPGQNWQPDWSPDGKNIVYRSEDGDGGLFVVPALGGEGLQRKIATFGFYPRWSPDSSQILFQTHFPGSTSLINKFYVIRLDGTPPREVLADFIAEHKLSSISAVWHPDGKRISIWVVDSVGAVLGARSKSQILDRTDCRRCRNPDRDRSYDRKAIFSGSYRSRQGYTV